MYDYYKGAVEYRPYQKRKMNMRKTKATRPFKVARNISLLTALIILLSVLTGGREYYTFIEALKDISMAVLSFTIAYIMEVFKLVIEKLK